VDSAGNRKFFGRSICAVYPKALGTKFSRSNAKISNAAANFLGAIRVMLQRSKQDSCVVFVDSIASVIFVEHIFEIGNSITPFGEIQVA